MPFGLTNAPSTFQAAMNDLFRPVLRKFVLVFFDDILIYSRTREDHYNHLKFVFQTLHQHNFFAKPAKCIFGVPDISFLGHRISAKGVAPEPDKIEAIQQWPTPTSFTTLRAFLGLTGYYRRFVKSYAQLAAPLTDILKLREFSWSPKAGEAFQELKDHMERLVTLALPNFDEPFDVTTDASGQAIGAVLSQKNQPIAFFSKKLCPMMQAQSTYTKELYAITEAVKKWRQYLLGSRFRIYTDHHSLKHILSQTIQTPEQQKWLTKLMGYDFEIHFKPGCQNTVADALSRMDIPSLLAISYPTATWLCEFRQYYKNDATGSELVRKIQQDPTAFPDHSFRDGLLYIHGKLLVPPITDLRARLIEEFHSSFLGGHSGVSATTKRLATSFTWLGLKRDVAAFIKQCHTCQTIKTPTHKPYGLLQPLPTPEHPWVDISMDFITGLPNSKGKTTIWVVVDRLTKFAHFIALSGTYTAVSLASIFMKEIYRLHGLPKTIVSDRDPIFVSHFWRELFKQMGTKLLHSSAYHPQTDGQTEVVNRGLEMYLRAFVSETPKLWERYLYLAEFSYNTNHHTAIEMSPFQALYGRQVSTIHDYVPGTAKCGSIEESLLLHQKILDSLKTSLEAAKHRMIKQANKHRIEKEFAVGDYVYLRLHKYRQSSVHHRVNQKLARRFYGPYKILQRIGSVAYKLELPADTKIHPVFHVSLLKASFGPPGHSTGDLSKLYPDVDIALLPESVEAQRNWNGLEQVLIKWDGKPIEEATWENVEEIQIQFPGFLDIEGNVQAQGVGDDTIVGTAAMPTSGPATRPERHRRMPARLLD